MRKVKVAAAFLCLFASGAVTGVSYQGNAFSVAHADQSDQLLEIKDEPVTTTASIETTDFVTTTTTTTVTKARTTTSSAATSAVNAKKKTTTVSTSAATTTTTATTSAATDAPETTTTPAATEAVTEERTTEDTTVRTTVTTLTETVTEPVTEIAEAAPAVNETSESCAISVTEREYIMLCNVVGHEYGADWVPVEEKALVAEVIMNRVNSPLFPNSVYEVLTQPYQFAGLENLIEMDTMSYYVTPSVREAVDLYLAHPEQFDHGYLFFNGDGYRNYFRANA